MSETVVGWYDNLKDAERAVDELLREGLERSRLQLEEVAEALDLRSLGYVPEGRLTSGQGAFLGMLVGLVLGIIGALLALWIFPLAYPGGFADDPYFFYNMWASTVLAPGVTGALVMGGLLGAIGGGLAGAVLNAAPPQELRGASARERVRLVVQTTDAQAEAVLAAMRHHHPISVEPRVSR